jgi:hypothetical protein
MLYHTNQYVLSVCLVWAGFTPTLIISDGCLEFDMFASIQVKILLKLLFNVCSPISHPRGVLCLFHQESELLSHSKMAKG